jgi:FHS family Na+ dependent glucose MFS transporter 1
MATIFGGWIYTYVVELDITNEIIAAYLTSIFWGAFTLGRLISIPIAVRFKPNAILAGDLVGCLLSIGLVLLFPYSITAIWVGAAGFGLSAASLFPTTVSLVGRRVDITGKITSRFVIGSSLGAMIPPWIVGQLYEAVGAQSVLFSILVTLLAGILVFIFVMRETKKDNHQ